MYLLVIFGMVFTIFCMLCVTILYSSMVKRINELEVLLVTLGNGCEVLKAT